MNLYQIIILAIVEGFTEFLPVSSTGHLIIAQKLLGLKQVDEFTTVILQLAAIMAAFFYFRKRIIKIVKNTYWNIKNRQCQKDLGIMIVISILPTLAIAFILKDFINVLQNSTLVVGLSTIIFGIGFYLIEKVYLKNQKRLNLEQASGKNIYIIGLFQIFSLIPGVSRSGATVSGGLTQNMNFKDSIEVAFLMGMPIMLAASIYEICKTLSDISITDFSNISIGFLVSFLVALCSIKLTIGLLSRNGFFPFMIYRILFGLFILFFTKM